MSMLDTAASWQCGVCLQEKAWCAERAAIAAQRKASRQAAQAQGGNVTREYDLTHNLALSAAGAMLHTQWQGQMQL